MVLFTIVIPAVLIGGFIINSLRPKAQLRAVEVRVRK
jgi:hypothetical protein